MEGVFPEGNANGSRFMEAVVAETTPEWDDLNDGKGYKWCVGVGARTKVSTSNKIGSGQTNTDNMVKNCTSGAANSVRAYRGGGLTAGRWSLPSKDELTQTMKVRGVFGLHLTSNQGNTPLTAWVRARDTEIFFATDNLSSLDLAAVRSVRAF